jgi:hypothetical protein
MALVTAGELETSTALGCVVREGELELASTALAGFFARLARVFFPPALANLGFRFAAFLPPRTDCFPGAPADAVIAVTSFPPGEGELGISETTDVVLGGSRGVTGTDDTGFKEAGANGERGTDGTVALIAAAGENLGMLQTVPWMGIGRTMW